MGGWWDLMWASEKGKLPPHWRAGVAPSWSPPISHFEARSAWGKMAPSCLHYPCSLPASLAQPRRGKRLWRKTSLPLLKTPGVAQTSRSAFGWIPFIIQERPSVSSWTCYLSMLMIRHVLVLNLVDQHMILGIWPLWAAPYNLMQPLSLQGPPEDVPGGTNS